MRRPCERGGMRPLRLVTLHSGRLRNPARAALGAFCEELAALDRQCGFKKRGPGLMVGPT